MREKNIILLLLLMGLLLLNSCDKDNGGLVMSEEKRADARMEQIISAIKENDKESLKSLFSKKALDEANDFENDINYLFEFLQGSIDTWERDGIAGSESIRYGKKSSMIRFAINVDTTKDTYMFYVIDYYIDTIDPDNQGVYMLEVRLQDSPNTGAWQERMRAGLYIH